MRIDDITGVLYATFDNPDDAGIGLRLYETRNAMNVFKEYTLDRNAGPLDIDMEKGIAYVGHTSAVAGQGGVSVVDLIDDTVTHLDADAFGSAISGVGVDAKNGIAYLSSSVKSPAPMIVVGRQQAPRIVESPVAQTADEGSTVTFSADALGVPAPAVSWESRAAGAASWTPIDGATEPALEVVAADERHGTQYRAVFTNTIDGVAYSTRSASATLRIAGFVIDPGTPPGDDTPDGETPDGTTPDGNAPDGTTDDTRPGTSTTADSGKLAATGSAPLSAGVGALLLLVAGGVAFVLRRRRASTEG
jgi:hypothetical protein